MTVEQNNIRRIPKLNGVSKYRIWLMVIRLILWSYLLLNIVNDMKVISLGSEKAGNKTLKIFSNEKSDSRYINSDRVLSLSLVLA